MHACPQSTAGTIPISGRGSTYPTQTAKHILEWWVWLHVSFLSVYNCISINTIELVNSHVGQTQIFSEVDRTKCDPNDPDNPDDPATYNAGVHM